ncbi:CPBP family intramembrane metalloprotease [archaeon]|nr:CPBP family intramembrane metalloprotease [archaeon]
MELLALGLVWIMFLLFYPLSFFLMRSERVSPENRDFIHRWLFNFRFSFEKPIQNVVFPAIASIGMAFALKDLIVQYGLSTYSLPQIFLFSLFIFVVGEEIIYRGWIIPALLNIRSGWTLGEYAVPTITDRVSLVLLVVLGAAVFALAHTEPITPFLFGLLMGGMFITSKKNLVPSLTVHFTANFMVMLFFLNII